MDRDVVIVGAGVVGAAIARELTRYELDVTLLEAGPDVGAGTSKANTALLHTGFDAKPGTLEARLVARGYQLLSEYAPGAGIPVERTGALLVAWDEQPAGRVRRDRRALAGQRLRAIRELDADELYRREPNLGPGARGALEVPGRGSDLPVHHAARVRHRGGAGGLRAAPRRSRHGGGAPAGRRLSAWRPTAARSPPGSW